MKTVDLTILETNAPVEKVKDVAYRAARENSATVCVYPEHLHIVQDVMEEKNITHVPPIAVVGFPSVPAPTQEEATRTVWATKNAIRLGAKEIDMVLPLSFREIGPGIGNEGIYQQHYQYIKAVVDEARKKNIPVKVIVETAYLNNRQIAEACILAKIAGAEWVKTSTGKAVEDKLAKNKNFKDHQNATPHDVALMRLTVGDSTFDENGNETSMGVKASGGVRNPKQAQAMLRAGADRIGASTGINLRVGITNRLQGLALRESKLQQA